jgi:hypothetical protein
MSAQLSEAFFTPAQAKGLRPELRGKKSPTRSEHGFLSPSPHRKRFRRVGFVLRRQTVKVGESWTVPVRESIGLIRQAMNYRFALMPLCPHNFFPARRGFGRADHASNARDPDRCGAMFSA